MENQTEHPSIAGKDQVQDLSLPTFDMEDVFDTSMLEFEPII